MSDIRPVPETLFVMVCKLTASPVLLLGLITFKHAFNESIFPLTVMCLHYCKVSTIYILQMSDYCYGNVHIPHVFSPLQTTVLR